ncbi:MAG: hypothetical protein RMI79_02670 [Nitrososphaerota archaeon]|nr:hypothetical protein [Nitrososphaerota archaeon]
MDTLKVVMIILPVIVILFFSIFSCGMFNDISELRDRVNSLNSTLTIVYRTVILLNRTGETNAFIEIQELNLNPAFYEGKLVIVVGEIHGIVTIPEIRLPYNAIISSKSHSFGVLTNMGFKEGSKVIVRGIVAKGFQEYLTGSGWKRGGEVYYIVAVEIEGI